VLNTQLFGTGSFIVTHNKYLEIKSVEVLCLVETVCLSQGQRHMTQESFLLDAAGERQRASPPTQKETPPVWRKRGAV